MRTYIVSCFFLVIAGNAIAADMPRSWNPRLKSWNCTSIGGTSYSCREDFSMSCAKGSIFNPVDPGDKVDRNLPFHPPGNFLWVDGTGRCKITEQKGRSYLNMLTSHADYVEIEWGCEANRVDDAFVYGYCTVDAIRKPIGK